MSKEKLNKTKEVDHKTNTKPVIAIDVPNADYSDNENLLKKIEKHIKK